MAARLSYLPTTFLGHFIMHQSDPSASVKAYEFLATHADASGTSILPAGLVPCCCQLVGKHMLLTPHGRELNP